MTKEHPILFSAPMVRAILAGTKTQTRRVVKTRKDPDYGCHMSPGEIAGDEHPERLCPYGQPGDRLWVRESFRIGEDLGAGWEAWMTTGDRFVAYDTPAAEDYCVPADYVIPRKAKEVHNSEGTEEHWRSFGPIPSIHMPRWASRITLEITGVRVERLQSISDEDAKAEGAWPDASVVGDCAAYFGIDVLAVNPCCAFQMLWERINGPESWSLNPFVWVVEFKRLEAEA